MSGSATLDPGYALDNTMGAMMIGVIVSAVLHGITLLQAFMYFTNYKKDVWYLKALVLTTVSFDAIHLAMISHAVYHYVVSDFHNPDSLRFLTWTVLMEALFTGVNGGIVQTFYALRVFRLSKRNYLLTGIIVFLILATVGCGTVWVILSMQFKTYKQLLTISPLTITINALSTAADVTIAASLCLMLHRSRTGFKRSDNIINKLIIFIVNTGVLTTCCAVSSLICLIASPNSLIYATFYFCIGRFYTNSFLATLNARKSFSSQIDESSNMMMSVPPSIVSPHATTNSKLQNIAIRIDTTKEMNDGDRSVRPLSTHGTIVGKDDRDVKYPHDTDC
ncbi:hypothetical protein GALMADRAFT_251847 [Galerina marginata CBS 339.88]|uniref:DUF6534 domain-containing protein n=1 Tax=Galerina marginata (strain CBS 339.88) TaxID=685588 RepID=A0A067SZY3_GALM3|nr:hypothetical protein GALMADRAFT_251847 [Galerina marginata CBS 339.88]